MLESLNFESVTVPLFISKVVDVASSSHGSMDFPSLLLVFKDDNAYSYSFSVRGRLVKQVWLML